jgi:hypothetical protein
MKGPASFSLMLVMGTGLAQADSMRPGFQNCTPGLNPDQQRTCDRQASEQIGAGSRATSLPGGWQLVRTKNPQGGADAISVMHVADIRSSDIDFAGINIRCGPGGMEFLLIVLNRLSRSDQPTVVLSAGNHRSQFEASVDQTGQALLLPASTALAASEWQDAKEISIEIGRKTAPTIRGIVPLAGISSAMRTRATSCPK